MLQYSSLPYLNLYMWQYLPNDPETHDKSKAMSNSMFKKTHDTVPCFNQIDLNIIHPETMYDDILIQASVSSIYSYTNWQLMWCLYFIDIYML